jgi:hypothetical protein
MQQLASASFANHSKLRSGLGRPSGMSFSIVLSGSNDESSQLIGLCMGKFCELTGS